MRCFPAKFPRKGERPGGNGIRHSHRGQLSLYVVLRGGPTWASDRRKNPVLPSADASLNLKPSDTGQERDAQFLIHVLVKEPVYHRLLHQKRLIERQKFLLRSLIPGLRPEQQFLKVQAHHLAMRL